MSMRANELRQKRGKAVAEARSLITVAEGRPEGQRKLSSDEERQYQAHMTDVDELGKEIEREERLSAHERDLGLPQGSGAFRPDTGNGGTRPPLDVAQRAYRRFLTSGQRVVLTAEEHRALQADSDSAGGYLVMPRQESSQLLKAVDNDVFMRRPGFATIERVDKAQSLGVVSLDADPDDADWTTEVKAITQDESMSFGDRELVPHPLTKGVKLSNKLMRLAADPEGLVRRRLQYKFSVTMEKAYMTGHGAGRPLGIFVASTKGISTGRDVSTGNATTSIGADGLIESKYSLKPQYWANAKWIFHRDGVKQIAKLKDGEGQYLWQPGLQGGQPDRLLNLPLFMSEYAPNTFTTGQYVGILGDFSFYWIVDALDVQIQRLDELYAETRQTGFIGEAYSDGMPVLEEAFVRVKLA